MAHDALRARPGQNPEERLDISQKTCDFLMSPARKKGGTSARY
jgi:hypothetical protein